MASEVMLSGNLKSELHSAEGAMRDYLMRRLSDILLAAVEREVDDDMIVVLGLGSGGIENGDVSAISTTNTPKDRIPNRAFHPAQIGAYYGFQWAIRMCDDLGLGLDIWGSEG